ncbi:MAG: DUF362 domain-containing protein [Promethearchaeota archaeon]
MKGENSWFERHRSLKYRLVKLINEINLFSNIEKGDLVAVKVHFGDDGTTRAIRSLYIYAIVKLIKKRGAHPFVTESCGLGMKLRRTRADGRLEIAKENGYTSETVGCPIIICDGLLGIDDVCIEIDNAFEINKIHVASAIAHADKMVVVSHVKGHPQNGMGGAIKNLGVGCVSKYGKFQYHVNDFIKIDENKCTGCGKCLDACPTGAIKPSDSGKFYIDQKTCVLCTGCNEVCDDKAIIVNWGNSREIAPRLVDNARGVIKALGKENICYINFVMDIVPVCDCIPYSDNPIVPDIGVLTGFDPLAIDKASYDLIVEQPILPNSLGVKGSSTPFKSIFEGTTNSDPKHTFEFAKKTDIGSIDYEIVEF